MLRIVGSELRHRKAVWLITVLALVILGGLFAREHFMQYRYIQTYAERLQKGIVTQKKLDQKDGIDIFGKRYQYELDKLHAGPMAYAAAYLPSLTTALEPNDGGRPKINYIASRAIGVTGSGPIFGGHEWDNTIHELTIVTKQKLLPFYPARQLTDEMTAVHYGQDPDSYADNIEMSAARFYTAGWYFIGHAVRENWLLPVILLCVLSYGTLFANELNRNHRHLQLLTVNGVNPLALWAIRFALVVLTTVAAVVVPIGVFLLVSRPFAVGGSLRYPILIWHLDGTQTFTTLGNYLGRTAGLLLLVIILGYSVIMFWSVVTRNGLIAAVLTALTAGVGFFIQKIAWLPFSYLNVGAAGNGFTFYQMGHGTLTQAVIVLSGWSVGLLVITFGLLYRNRRYGYDFRN